MKTFCGQVDGLGDSIAARHINHFMKTARAGITLWVGVNDDTI